MHATLCGMPLYDSEPTIKADAPGSTLVREGCKRCTKCLRLKPLLGFPVSAKHPHGVRSVCRMCKADYMRQWRRRTARTYATDPGSI
jgi:hypothetical protein